MLKSHSPHRLKTHYYDKKVKEKRKEKHEVSEHKQRERQTLASHENKSSEDDDKRIRYRTVHNTKLLLDLLLEFPLLPTFSCGNSLVLDVALVAPKFQ